MPMQTGKSNLNLGARARQFKDAPIDYGQDFSELPGDINGGIAKLVELKVGTYKEGANKGKPFFLAAGIVLEPKMAVHVKKVWENGGVRIVSSANEKIEGRRTQITVPLCTTSTKDKSKTTSEEENIGKMFNEVKKLAGEACLDGIDSDADLMALFDMLKKSGILFKFNTRLKEPNKEYPSSGVWPHNWRGMVSEEDYQPGETNDGVQDSTGGNEAPDVPDDAPPPDDADASAGGDAQGEPGDHELDELAERADAKDAKGKPVVDQEAIDRLTDLAKEAGIDDADVANADNWTDVANLIRQARDAGAEAGAADEPLDEPFDSSPQVGDNFSYQVIDPKTKKPATDPKNPKKVARPVMVEVISTDKTKSVSVVRSLQDKKTKWTVPFDQLIPV